MQVKKIFLASSEELKDDRHSFADTFFAHQTPTRGMIAARSEA